MLPPPGLTPTLSSTLSSPIATIPVSDVVLLASSSIGSPGTTALFATSSIIANTVATAVSSPTPAAAAAAVAAVATTMAAALANGPSSDNGNGECRLLGPFALFIQGALGLLATLSLVWKRYRERPQRPLKIWSFDVSKQFLGSVLVHIANLLMSMLSAGQFTVHPKVAAPAASGPDEIYSPNPCSFYLLNLAIDTTIGIPILIILLRLLTSLFLRTPLGNPPESLQSGNYGRPPRTLWWIKQSLVYFCGLMGMKICVLFIFTVLPWISRVGDWALKWTEGNEALQVGFVMLLFPCIMNAIQYYIIDGFIKDQKPLGHEAVAQEEEHGRGDDYDADASDVDADADAVVAAKDGAKATHTNKKPRRPSDLTVSADGMEYDPDTDGDESPTVVGSGSGSGSRSSRRVKADDAKKDSD